MTSVPVPDPLVELRWALAEADASDPPARLADSVAEAAFTDRPPGRLLHEPEPITSDVVFARAVDSLDTLLGALEEGQWRRPCLRDLDVQGLVGHLIGVEHDFHAALDEPESATGATHTSDHVEATQADAAAQRGRSPSDTYEDWRGLARRSIELLGHRAMSDEACLHGLLLPLDRLMIVRAFELWTHEEDIRRAVGRPLSAPDPSSLQRMVNLAVQVLPRVLSPVDPDGAPSTARLVLTGDAGGAFLVELRSRHPGPSEVRIVADAVTFCRLAANRIPADEVAVSVAGDQALADELLAGTAALALD